MASDGYGRDFFSMLASFKPNEAAVLCMAEEDMDLFDRSLQQGDAQEVLQLLRMLRADLMPEGGGGGSALFTDDFIVDFTKRFVAARKAVKEQKDMLVHNGADADDEKMLPPVERVPNPLWAGGDAGSGGFLPSADEFFCKERIDRQGHHSANSSVDNSDRAVSHTGALSSSTATPRAERAGYQPLSSGDSDDNAAPPRAFSDDNPPESLVPTGEAPVVKGSVLLPTGATTGTRCAAMTMGTIVGTTLTANATSAAPTGSRRSSMSTSGGGLVVSGVPLAGVSPSIPIVAGVPLEQYPPNTMTVGTVLKKDTTTTVPPPPPQKATLTKGTLQRYRQLKAELGRLTPPPPCHDDDGCDNYTTTSGPARRSAKSSSNSSHWTAGSSPFLDFYRGAITIMSPETQDPVDVMSLIALLPMVTATEFPFLTTTATANALFPIHLAGDCRADNTSLARPITTTELAYARDDVTVRLRIIGLAECFIAAMGLESFNNHGGSVMYYEAPNATAAQVAALQDPAQFRNCLRLMRLLEAVGNTAMANGLGDFFGSKLEGLSLPMAFTQPEVTAPPLPLRPPTPPIRRAAGGDCSEDALPVGSGAAKAGERQIPHRHWSDDAVVNDAHWDAYTMLDVDAAKAAVDDLAAEGTAAVNLARRHGLMAGDGAPANPFAPYLMTANDMAAGVGTSNATANDDPNWSSAAAPISTNDGEMDDIVGGVSSGALPPSTLDRRCVRSVREHFGIDSDDDEAAAAPVAKKQQPVPANSR